MGVFDYSLIVAYVVLLLGLGFYRRLGKSTTAAEMIVGGRLLTLPAFVASLVSTWYGGILGVGEYSWRYGISNWLVFGVPYYVAAILFAVFLAKRARESEVLTIPDKLAEVYGDRTAAIGGIVVYVLTIPASYILMLGILGQQIFGWPFWLGVVLGSIASIVYVYFGGFDSVIRTDILQFGLMFLGFAILLIAVVWQYGGMSYLVAHLPANHLTWSGGNSAVYIATWYVIALETLIQPAFYQRCYAAKTISTARTGIFVSIGCWVVFDFLTTFCGLYARAILPAGTDPLASYPDLAAAILPTGLLGLFALALLATVMSTVDSYSFLAASTFGNDIMQRFGWIDASKVTRYTRVGLIISSVLAVVIALFFRSVVDLWYVFGSVGTPALLVPVFAAFVIRSRRLPARWAVTSILLGGGLSALWVASPTWTSSQSYWFGIQPIFPGLVVSLAIFALFSSPARTALPSR